MAELKTTSKKGLYIVSGRKSGSSAVRYFSTLGCKADGILVPITNSTVRQRKIKPTFTVSRLKLTCGSSTVNISISDNLKLGGMKISAGKFFAWSFYLKEKTFSTNSTLPTGTWKATIELSWKYTYNGTTLETGSGTVTFSTLMSVVAPKWTKEFTIGTQANPVQLPPITGGYAQIEYIRVYKNGGVGTDDSYYYRDPLKITNKTDYSFTFSYTFNENQVSSITTSPTVKVAVKYKSAEKAEKAYRTAFYSTTRNQNYSNGIYNEVFVSGATANANYNSRVWWSEVNNPLYFPDTNYSEVGSNDTSIQGLTKVGDYLAVVKKSKTTDTAIYLLYPTSFEEETTFAVKQGVQGVGALARYSFNILGDETLFLSPQGVMAIVPSQDEEHKVQNRSYFIDGKLLKEPNLADSYSFVFDGKYYLSMGDGKVYVLDGNQRNSWGNDRTNLVYECYCLDNVPAKCFVKYQDKLVFSDGNNVCAFNDGYVDAYNGEGLDVPVSAEWSTVFDDDNALHYYKTMQKKGNLVSILPRENELPYKEVDIDEDTFNENKALYFTYEDDKYVRCTAESVYDPDTQYFVENRSSTKVFVKKDDKDLVEIERSFGLSSDIPSEMYLRKKFKKYKRLQFVIKNEEAEPFGVDEIVKNYTVGNYAKK